MATFYIEQSSTDEKFLFKGNGDEPPRRKKRYVTRDRRIEHLVQSYEPNLDKLIPGFSEKCNGRELMFKLFTEFNLYVICYS